MSVLEILVSCNFVAIIFGSGALWQQVRDINRRVTRIENKVFNGTSRHAEA